tara:strand:+ start:128 stop:268 length:141 start_codon:yes stop_codon:yes gene_type:complete
MTDNTAIARSPSICGLYFIALFLSKINENKYSEKILILKSKIIEIN